MKGRHHRDLPEVQEGNEGDEGGGVEGRVTLLITAGS